MKQNRFKVWHGQFDSMMESDRRELGSPSDPRAPKLEASPLSDGFVKRDMPDSPYIDEMVNGVAHKW